MKPAQTRGIDSQVALFLRLRSGVFVRHTRTLAVVLALVLVAAGCGDDGGGGGGGGY